MEQTNKVQRKKQLPIMTRIDVRANLERAIKLSTQYEGPTEDAEEIHVHDDIWADMGL